MKQYKLEIYAYKPNGAPGGLTAVKYADTQEEVRTICREYESQYQYTTDPETGDAVQTNMKAYAVDLLVLCYKKLDNKAAFLANFEA